MVILSWVLCLLIQWNLPSNEALVVPISTANPKESLAGVTLRRVLLDDEKDQNENESLVDIGVEVSKITDQNARTMVVFGTHAGDFNTIEYLQKVRFSFDQLTTRGGIGRILVVVNGEPHQIRLLASFLDLPPSIEFFSDPSGEAGRSFGCDQGFRPDDDSLSPFVKQFFTGIGIGPPWMTLPAVLPGYIGDPNGKRDWIEASLKQGQLAGRWPKVLELDDSEERILGNKFDDAPLGVGNWGRRPFELATLRLQSLIGIQIKYWDKLKPVVDDCLTQLGGCAVVQADGTSMYSWVDKGLCDVPDMDDLLDTISGARGENEGTVKAPSPLKKSSSFMAMESRSNNGSQNNLSRRSWVSVAGAAAMSTALLSDTDSMTANAFPNAIPDYKLYIDRPKRKGDPPRDLGILPRTTEGIDAAETSPRLRTCSGNPNCFSTTGDARLEDRQQYGVDFLVPTWIPPPEETKPLQTVAAVVASYEPGQGGIDGGGFALIKQTDSYLYYQFEALKKGYIDDLEFATDKATTGVMVRSASRVGVTDFGVNAIRLNYIGDKLRSKGWKITEITPETHRDYWITANEARAATFDEDRRKMEEKEGMGDYTKL